MEKKYYLTPAGSFHLEQTILLLLASGGNEFLLRLKTERTIHRVGFHKTSYTNL